MFNRFWRADPSRNRRTGGTGLGLSISLEDARLHGGWLEAWGERGYGAVFRLTLPCTHGHELTGSPLPLQPTDLPAHEADAPQDDSPEQVELTEAEITWQPAQPVEDIEPEEPKLAWDSEKAAEPARITWGSEQPVDGAPEQAGTSAREEAR